MTKSKRNNGHSRSSSMKRTGNEHVEQLTRRRDFLSRSTSVVLAAGAPLGFRFEDRALLAQKGEGAALPSAKDEVNSKTGDMPAGKIRDVTISRLICGGNLISGFAHSRDLIYVSSLLKHYFTDKKVHETLELCERNGIDTAILRLDNDTLRIITNYWHERGGKIQWIAQIKPAGDDDLTTDTLRALDNGATGVYLQGGVADRFVRRGRVDLIAKALECMKDNAAIAGIAGHDIRVVIECEKAGLEPDFYMKTINSKQYWSAGPEPRHDSVWAETPEKTIEVMQRVDKPWIGFKVLGAGAIHPREGFAYACENGADFLCVGMFDFQVEEDARIVREQLAGEIERRRP